MWRPKNRGSFITIDNPSTCGNPHEYCMTRHHIINIPFVGILTHEFHLCSFIHWMQLWPDILWFYLIRVHLRHWREMNHSPKEWQSTTTTLKKIQKEYLYARLNGVVRTDTCTSMSNSLDNSVPVLKLVHSTQFCSFHLFFISKLIKIILNSSNTCLMKFSCKTQFI